jgi:hypothetical protein
MSTSQSVAQAVADAAQDLDDGFALSPDDPPKASNVTFLSDRRAARPAPKTLAECVPLLTVALQFVDRGPSALTVEHVEEYRANAIRLLEHVQPVLEREAGMTLSDWSAAQIARSAAQIARRGTA